MYSSVVVISLIFNLVMIVWIVVLSVLFFKERKIRDRLFPSEGISADAQSELLTRFSQLTEVVAETNRRNDILSKQIKEVAKDGLHHIQKIKIRRYNPYQDTGGDQSFSVVLLSGNLDGVLITSLHSRSGTRIYAKHIRTGKSDVELAKEEKEVLDEAMNQ